MKIQAMYLGEYNTSSHFYLYRIPTTASPPLHSPSTNSVSPTIKPDYSGIYYYCLEDLEGLRLATTSFQHVNTVQLYRDYPTAFCKNADDGYTYVNTHILYDLAGLFKSTLLMDLCRLTIHTPKEKLKSLLNRITLLRTTSLDHQTPCHSDIANQHGNDIISTGHLVKQVLHPVRLDGQEWFLQPWMQHSQQQQQQQQPLMIRLSPPTEDNQSLLHTSTTTTNSGTSAKQQSSSLLLQRRLAPKLGNHTPQLTINTPAYKDHPLHMIQSAPLRKSISKHQINKRLQAAAVAACTATGLHPPSSHLHQPIIASHHHPKQHFQHRRLRPSLSPPTNNSDNNNNKKQQFLQPFEYLHNSLEHVRAQKIRLDDTIRQSSTWLGKLQDTLPGIIETIVADEMDGWMTNYTNQLQHCMDRILSLERKTTVDQQQKAAESGDELMVLMRRLEQLEEKANST